MSEIQVTFQGDAKIVRILTSMYALLSRDDSAYPPEVLSDFLYLCDLLGEFVDADGHAVQYGEGFVRDLDRLFPHRTHPPDPDQRFEFLALLEAASPDLIDTETTMAFQRAFTMPPDSVWVRNLSQLCPPPWSVCKLRAFILSPALQAMRNIGPKRAASLRQLLTQIDPPR